MDWWFSMYQGVSLLQAFVCFSCSMLFWNLGLICIWTEYLASSKREQVTACVVSEQGHKMILTLWLLLFFLTCCHPTVAEWLDFVGFPVNTLALLFYLMWKSLVYLHPCVMRTICSVSCSRGCFLHVPWFSSYGVIVLEAWLCAFFKQELLKSVLLYNSRLLLWPQCF